MRMTFLLGVRSVDDAMSALKTLPFVRIDERGVATKGEKDVKVLNVDDGALIVLGGDFTPDEITAAERMGSYEHAGMHDFVGSVLAKFTQDAVRDGLSGTVRVLTKSDASDPGSVSTLRINTEASSAAREATGSEKPWWQFWK